MTRPARAPLGSPNVGRLTNTPLLPARNGARFSLLNALKKLKRRSRPAASPRTPNEGRPNRFARLKSTEVYFGPRNTLRPMPGGLSSNVGVPVESVFTLVLK